MSKQQITASPVKGREGLYVAWGINPDTLKRQKYFANTPEEAAQKAADSLKRPEPLETLDAYYAEAYLPTIAYRSENWQSQVGWAMDGYVRPTFGDRKMRDIKRPEAQRFFNSLIGRLEVSSIRRIKIVFSGVMNLAEADDQIAKNPVRLVRLPQEEAPEKTSLTHGQLARLIRFGPRELLPPLYLSAVVGGLRIGEACGVARANMTLDSLKVCQQVLQLKGGAKTTPKLKTLSTKRIIPLPTELGSLVLSYVPDGVEWVCSNADGGYLLPNNVTRMLASACLRADVPIISPHELRHTFISLLENELEAPTAIVAALAGKSHKSVTAGYSHTHRQQLEKWLARHFERVQREVEKVGCGSIN
jgi:integrase